LSVQGLSALQYQDSLQYLFGNFNNTSPDILTTSKLKYDDTREGEQL